MMNKIFASVIALSAMNSAAIADGVSAPFAGIAASQQEATERVERGFARVQNQFGRVRQGFEETEREIRYGVKRDASIAALAAIPSQPDGWSIGVGLSVEERHGATGGAVSFGYRDDEFAFFAAASGPAPVFTVGLSFRLK